MAGSSVGHGRRMPEKGIIRRAVPVLLLSALCAGVLSGCSYLVRQREKRDMERVSSEMALAYVEDTYGGRAEILEVEVGTCEVIFHAEIDSDALVTVSLEGETFQVYVETREPSFCADNRSGLALEKALDAYFRKLYGLPEALEHSVRIYPQDEDFFASCSTNPGYGYSFLDFDYHGQPLEEVLPLVGGLSFRYGYLDDSVSLDQVALRDEDWGGAAGERMGISIRCFRRYNEQSAAPIGIRLDGEQPVLMAEGMVFSRHLSSYRTLDDIAHTLPHLALREQLRTNKGQLLRQRWQIAPMGDCWISTQEGFTAESCYELYPCETDWADSVDLLAMTEGAYFSREELLDKDTEMAVTTRKTLLPFADARFEAAGDQLRLREGVRERIDAWHEEDIWPVGGERDDPVYVTVRPSRIYQSDAQMAAGRERQREDGRLHHCAELYTSHLEEEEHGIRGLSCMSYSAPQDLVLLRVEETADPGQR